MALTTPRGVHPGDCLVVIRMSTLRRSQATCYAFPLASLLHSSDQFMADGLNLLDDFDARGNDELNLRRGEKIELVELDDGFGDGWYLGKDVKSGTTGLFPGGTSPATTKEQLPCHRR